jgi:Fe2+ transport system protein FeoA
MKLGNTVDSIRNRNGYSKYKQELEEMGFDFEWHNWDLVKRALKAYKSKTGDLLVPYDFIIPAGDTSWEQDLWGMKLGKTVDSIRNKNHYSGYKQELEEMGFDYVSQHLRRWQRTKKALLAYKSEYGDLTVDRSFVIPSNPSWELDLWDMNLGACVINIRNSNGYKAHRQELEEMGFY